MNQLTSARMTGFCDLLEAVSLTQTLTAILVILVLGPVIKAVFLAIKWRQKGYLTGPLAVPLLGNVLQAGSHMPTTWMKLSEKYGKVFLFYIFDTPTVVVNGYENIMFTRQHRAFGEKTPFLKIQSYAKQGYGLFFNVGQGAVEHRRIMLQFFGVAGAGRTKIEGIILDEFATIATIFKDNKGGPYDYRYTMATAIANVTCCMLFGKQFSYDDPDFTLFVEHVNTMFSDMQVSALAGVLPLLKYLPGDPVKYRRSQYVTKKIFKFLEENIARVKKEMTHSDVDSSKDIVSSYLRAMESQQHVSLNEESLLVLCFDSFIAGTHTTAMTIMWTIIFLLRHPEAQDYILSEIKEEFGTEVLFKHRSQMPYTRAFITEVQRFVTVVPFTPSSTTVEEVEIDGVRIPPGLPVISNFQSVHHDPEIFPKPDVFDPERHLDENGKYQKPKKFLPFGEGSRICLGLTVAELEMWAFTSNIVKNFVLKPEDGCPPPSYEGVLGATYNCLPFKFCASPRNKTQMDSDALS